MATAVNDGRMLTRSDAYVRHTIEVRFNPATNQFFTTPGTIISPTHFAQANAVQKFADGGYLVHPRNTHTSDDYLVLGAQEHGSGSMYDYPPFPCIMLDC